MDLKGIRTVPSRIAQKALAVAAVIEATGDYRRFGGKRHAHHNRAFIGVPIGRRYRLVCIDHGRIRPAMVVSHERYNGLKRRMA